MKVMYTHEVPEDIFNQLEETYFSVEAKKSALNAVMTNPDSTPEMLAAYDKLHTDAFKAFEMAKDRLMTEVIPELQGNGNFSWRADFTRGLVVVTYNGEQVPELPEAYVKINENA